MASIEIKGVSELTKKLGRMASVDVLRPAMNRSVERLRRDMAVYPSQPALANYKRTGTLGRKWATRVTTNNRGMVGTVGNNTPYAPYVQGHLRQNIHLGYWQTNEDVIEQNRAAIVGDFQRVINEVLK